MTTKIVKYFKSILHSTLTSLGPELQSIHFCEGRLTFVKNSLSSLGLSDQQRTFLHHSVLFPQTLLGMSTCYKEHPKYFETLALTQNASCTLDAFVQGTRYTRLIALSEVWLLYLTFHMNPMPLHCLIFSIEIDVEQNCCRPWVRWLGCQTLRRVNKAI